MMEAGLISLLVANNGVHALVGGRIYPLLLPETPTLPAVTYQVISTVPVYSLDGAAGAQKVRIEFNAWANTYGECKQVSAAIRTTLESYRGALTDSTFVATVAVVNSTDYYDDTARLYRVQTDYSFWATA